MARNENPPFDAGQTFYNGGTIDSNNLGGTQMEGKEWVFEDIIPTTRQARSNRYVTRRVVRNVSGGNLLPSRLVQFETDGLADYGARVSGYASVLSQRCFPVDEWLPATGVVNNDLFYIVVKGPCVVLTDLAAGTPLGISVGDLLVSQTAATSGATTAGRAIQLNSQYASTATTASVAIDAALNVIGRACSSNATTQTNTGILVDVGIW